MESVICYLSKYIVVSDNRERGRERESPREKGAIGTVIEDLGLNWKLKDQRLGFRGTRLSIKEKIALTKKKVKVFKSVSDSVCFSVYWLSLFGFWFKRCY